MAGWSFKPSAGLFTMMTELQTNITEDLRFMEEELGNPNFTFNGQSYAFIPSVAEFKRELETGGFRIAKLLTATVRKLNCDGSPRFTTLPTAQNKIIYSVDGLTYRLEKIETDPTGAYFVLVGVQDNKGV